MSKKGLKKFYDEVLPELKKKYKSSSNWGNEYFDYGPRVWVKKSNGKIEPENIFDIEGLPVKAPFDNDMLQRLLNPWTEPRINLTNGCYRWAGGYGTTWALTKEELETSTVSTHYRSSKLY